MEREVLLMISNMKNNDFSHVTSLAIEAYNGPCSDYENPVAASERFFRAASLLSAGGCLGFQVSSDKEGGCDVIAFSSMDTNITAEDYKWIFHGCANIEATADQIPEDRFWDNRQVYALLPRVICDETGEQSPGAKSNKQGSDHFSQLLDMMLDMGAVLRIVAKPVYGSSVGRGNILISLQQALPLRLRTMLAMAFPGTVVRVFDELTQTGGLLDGSFLKSAIAELLHALMLKRVNEVYAKRVREFAEFGGGEIGFDNENPEFAPFEGLFGNDYNDEFDDEQTTSIDELDLSVRSYNCLKRAGILSVEKLRTMSDDELMRVRNLGKKNINEIRQKLAQTSEIAKISAQKRQTCMEMLNALIGLDEVKSQIKKLAAFAKLKQNMKGNEHKSVPMVLNMEFVGNPGTAKTTVARIVAGILHEIELLPQNELVEVGRADLVAEYEGQTAAKVKKVFQKAKGKLLFIDEAYALTECGRNNFGDEAINTIVQEMENNREDTVVIFAGYPDKMEEFLARNPGLRSRVPFLITFPDYSADEMVQIAQLEAEKRGFTISPDALEKVRSLCMAATQRPDTGNGRYCRNLIEDAILNYALRIYGNDAESSNANFALSGEDFPSPKANQSEREERTIGFAVD